MAGTRRLDVLLSWGRPIAWPETVCDVASTKARTVKQPIEREPVVENLE